MLPTEGKYFLIVNNDCNLSVGIKNQSDDPDEPVVLCNQNDKEEHQIWFEDFANGVIRSLANEYCLSFMPGAKFVKVSEYLAGNEAQLWTVGDGYIVHRTNKSKVLDAQVPLSCGTKLCVSSNAGDNKWKAVYLKPKLFYIVSQMHQKVLEIEDDKSEPGKHPIMFPKKPIEEKPENQLWYEDKQGNIRSALNNFVFDSSDPDVITMQPMDESNQKRHWIIYGKVICNRYDKSLVLDIKNNETEDGAKVCAWKYSGMKNQAWWFHKVV